MIEDYSDNPVTIASRRCYHKKTAAQKTEIFRKQYEQKKARVAQGKCRVCGKPRERLDIQKCNKCREKHAQIVKNYRIQNALDGKCCKCSNPADGDSSHCKKCKRKARLAMRKRKQNANSKTT